MSRQVKVAVVAGLVLAVAGFTAGESIRQRDLAEGRNLPGCWASLWHHGYLWPAVLGLGGGALAAGSGLARVVGSGLLGGAVALLAGVAFADCGRGAGPPFGVWSAPPPWPTSALELFFRFGEVAGLWLLLGAGLGAVVGLATLEGGRIRNHSRDGAGRLSRRHRAVPESISG